VIEDEDAPSRAPTPRPPEKDGDDTRLSAAQAQKDDGHARDSGNKSEEDQSRPEKAVFKTPATVAEGELPQDVQLKLRKLQKLENRYHGMQTVQRGWPTSGY